jgi:hypothetical protein
MRFWGRRCKRRRRDNPPTRLVSPGLELSVEQVWLFGVASGASDFSPFQSPTLEGLFYDQLPLAINRVTR